MRKGRVGLQKEISRIFTGVQVPKSSPPAEKRSVPEPKNHPAVAVPAQNVPPKPVASSPHPSTIAVPPKPLVPSPHPSTIAVPPKPLAPSPRPFTIPEPTEHNTPPATKPAVYEPPPVPAASAPAPVAAPVSRPKPEPRARPPSLNPLLKIWKQLKDKLPAGKPGENAARQKVMILVTPVLAVVFIIVLMHMLRTSANSAAKPVRKTASAAFGGEIDWKMPPLYPDTLRDPMTFASSFTQNQTQAEAGRVAVKGIVYSEDKPCAVVGDRIVSVGDDVDGAKVVKITPDSVEFAIGDKTWTQKVER